MSFFETYKKYLNVQGGNVLGSQKESMKQTILSGFYSNPSYTTVYINNSTTPSDVWIVDDSKVKEIKILTTKPNDTMSTTLSIGDLVKWNNENWLTLIVDDMQIYDRANIQKCPSTLVFQNSSLSTIIAPFTIESSTSQLGLDEGRVISLPNERRNIIIQSNVDTQKIVKGQRFIFDGRAWSVTSRNGLYDGLIHLTLQEDEINTATDNVDLRIADYVEFVTPETTTIPEVGYSIVIVGSDTIKQNQTQVYTAEVYTNGVLVTDGSQLVTWSVYADDKVSVTSLGTISTQDGIKCSVKNNNVTSGYTQLKVELQNDSSVITWKRIEMKPLW